MPKDQPETALSAAVLKTDPLFSRSGNAAFHIDYHEKGKQSAETSILNDRLGNKLQNTGTRLKNAIQQILNHLGAPHDFSL